MNKQSRHCKQNGMFKALFEGVLFDNNHILSRAICVIYRFITLVIYMFSLHATVLTIN